MQCDDTDPTVTPISKGESLDFTFCLDDEDMTNWTNTIYVKEFPEDVSALDGGAGRLIPPDANDANSWSGILSTADTGSLLATTYYLIAKIANSVTAEEVQKTKRFSVSDAWA